MCGDEGVEVMFYSAACQQRIFNTSNPIAPETFIPSK
jgi:hypothetical protein